MLSIYILWKHHQTHDFLMFSGSKELEFAWNWLIRIRPMSNFYNPWKR